MTTANEGTSTFLAGFVVGGLIGTAIAQIFAPQTGVVVNANKRMPWQTLKVRTTQRFVHDGSANASLSSS